MVDCKDGPDLDPFFEVVDRHHNARREYEALKKALEGATSQYRALQKRLLAKLKDTTQTDADDFGEVMEATYQEVRFEDQSQTRICQRGSDVGH